MFENDSGLHVGTSSWSSRDWVGRFYPLKTPSNRFIEHYAKIYDTVEIDATFYAMPGDVQIQAWRRRTPESFVFSAKVPRIITHDRKLVDAHDDMMVFVETMSGLGPRLGPMLLQFPYFRRDTFASVEPFLERLDGFLAGLPRPFQYVVEVRNPSWVGPALHEVCQKNGVSLAWVARARMPEPADWQRLVGGEPDPVAYIRFLGDHHAIERITKKWDRVVMDREDELAAWIPVIQKLRFAGTTVFSYVNNHFAGNAPQTIETLRSLWRQSKGEDPLPNRFEPEDPPEQLGLF